MAAKSELELVNAATREAMFFWFGLMDDMSGGAFKRGQRPATDQERIREWDGLAPELKEQLRQQQGDEWFFGQAAEIEKLRVKQPEVH